MSTTFGVSCVLGIIAVAGALVWGVTGLHAQSHAQSGADLAALSAAQVLLSGDAPPCDIAAAVAASNELQLDRCSVAGERVEVTLGGSRGSATAVAGPVE